MAEKKFQTDLTEGNVAKKLLIFALPLFASNALQAVYNIVDMVVVGQVIGKTGMAGVSIGGDIFMFLTSIAFGFAGAGQVIIAQNVGAKRMEDVKKIIGTLFTFLLCAALCLTVLFFCLRYKVLEWINTPADSFDEAYSYSLTCAFGLIFIYGYNVVSSVLRGMGDSKRPFVFVAIAAVLNAVLDVLFVAVFKWRAFGAALATVIGQAVSFIVAAVYLYKNREYFIFDFKPASFKISKEHLKTILSLGIPMSIQTAAISMSRIIVASWINSFGSVATALSGIYNKFSHVTSLFGNAFTTSGASMIGQNIGAEKYDRVKKVIFTLLAIMICISGVFALVLNLIPDVVFSMFTSDTEVLEMAGVLLLPLTLFIAGAAGRSPAFALINGSGFSKLNLIIAILDGIVCRLSFCYIITFTLNQGVYGCWLGDGLAGFVPFIVGSVYFLTGKWKTNKYLIKRQMGKTAAAKDAE